MTICIEWSKEEKQLLRKLRPVFTTKEISDVFSSIGYTRSLEAIERKSRRLGIKFFSIGLPDTRGLDQDIVDTINSVLQKRRRLVTPPLHSTINRYPQRFSKEEEETALEWIEQLVQVRYDLNPPRIDSRVQTSHSDCMSLVVVLSDLHIGRTFKDLIENVSYNTDIAEQRCRKFTEEIISLYNKYNNVDEIVILLVGDLTDGIDIFPGQQEHSEITPLFQVHKATTFIWNMILSLRNITDSSIRVVTCRGNHGRVGKTTKISNWDNIVYQELELVADICNMRFNDRIYVSNNFNVEYNTANVKGWKFLIRHYAPAQADTPAAQKKFGNWQDIHHWDALIYGHWHHWGIMTWQGRPVFRNGSVMGADPYAEELAVYDEPAQLVFGVSKEKLPEFITPINLSL